jgi:HSP20 family molecular chaperone IbpA
MAAGEPPQELPVDATMDREWFRAVFAVSGVEPDNVTLRVEGDQLVVTIGIGGGIERIEQGSRRVEANARIWERSFKLSFSPVLSATRTTVTSDSVTVEAARLR